MLIQRASQDELAPPPVTETEDPGESRLNPEGALSAAALELARSSSESEVAEAVRAAARALIPGSQVRLSRVTPRGWQLLLGDQEVDADKAALRFPLRAGGTLLGELAIQGPGPLPSEASTVSELASHAALALARLEYGRLLSGISPGADADVFAANSFRDPLTNLPSRMLFHDRVEHALHRRSRHVHPVAVLIIDLAGSITVVRDGMGDAAADRLLVQVAKRLQRLVRSADTLARFGDDQLAALLDDLDSAADAELVAERLSTAIAEPFVIAAGLPLSLQAHIGIAVNGGAAESAVELLQKAERAAELAGRRGTGVETVSARQRSRLGTHGARR